ncbi:fimbria/pilus periplasmic chaperone [Providencia sp. PROV117]|uniref:fimbria/pilus periplasmic chaperone n=1 Tax=Providencia sp. PROV117 TaxID=2949828 RepID=UPI00234A4825|nr:fimbria/pilus periplasmic chaperone [Providencia sp. PROV117]
MNKSIINIGTILISFFTVAHNGYAAIALDRTRAIYPGNEKSIVLNIKNENKKLPYLAQSWLENEAGEKIISPFLTTPPLQRVEPGDKSVIKITKTANISQLPQDRESVFYFNVREVPPKSDKPNVMQLALQTKIKLFYRPESIIPEKNTRWDNKIILNKENDGYMVENPTPYYINLIGITGAENQPLEKNFEAVMIEPKSNKKVKSRTFQKPFIRTINDFGGKPILGFHCQGNQCVADDI